MSKRKINGLRMNRVQKRFMKYAVAINAIMFIIILILLWMFSRRFIALFK